MADYARGERLRELRNAKHASQEAVAFMVGVSTKTVRSWEHGGKIRWENAKRLGGYYGVDPETLVARETSAPLPEITTPDPFAGASNSQLETQVAQISEQVAELHGLLLGADEEALAGLAARLLRAGGWPPSQADDPPEIPPGDSRRKPA